MILCLETSRDERNEPDWVGYELVHYPGRYVPPVFHRLVQPELGARKLADVMMYFDAVEVPVETFVFVGHWALLNGDWVPRFRREGT